MRTPARFSQAFIVLAALAVAAPVHAGWTAAIGRYSRSLERTRYIEYQAKLAEGPTYRPGGALSAYGGYAYGVPGFYDREYDFYLDRMRHWDYRLIEWRVRELLHHPFPRDGHINMDLRTPEFYIQHRWLEQELERRQYYRMRYSRYWRRWGRDYHDLP